MAIFFDYHGLRSLRTLRAALSVAARSPGYAAKQAGLMAKRNANLLLSPHTGGKSATINRVFLVLSWACDSRCRMCALWSDSGFVRRMDGQTIKGTMGIEDYERLLDELRPHDPQIVLFGGEPLLAAHWREVAERAKARGYRVTLSTDGSKLAPQAEDVCRTLDHFQVSLDGVDARTHDAIRRYPGLFDKALAGMAAVDEWKRRLGARAPLMDIAFMITPENFRQLCLLPDFIASLGLDIHTLSIQHLEYTTEERCAEHGRLLSGSPHVGYWRGLVREPPLLDVEDLVRQLAALRRAPARGFRHVAFNPEMDDDQVRRHYAGVPFRAVERCSLPWLEANVLPSGDVWVCPDYYAGNVKETPFAEIWNGARARAIRRFLNQGKRFAVCNNCMGQYLYG